MTRRLLFRLFFYAALLFLTVASAAVLQDRLLYFPERATVDQMQSPGMSAWPSADDFRGLVLEAASTPPGKVVGTVIVFHGNAGHAGHRRFYAEALNPLGFRVILAEYPAYGPRPGDVGESSLVSDAAPTIAMAHKQYGGPLIVVGESLGSGVAAAAAALHHDKLSGLMLITPWDSLENVAKHHYPWLPVGWLLRDRYDSAGNLGTFRHPVLVAVAERDSIVPARFGRALYERLPPTRKLTVIPDAEHNDWPDRVNAAWWREAMVFLLNK